MRTLAIIETFKQEILFSHTLFSLEKLGCFYVPENQKLNAIPFSNAKKILGREYPFAIYDIRDENGIHFNLDAFAILAGTIQENGILILLCAQWQTLEQEPDSDALRWNENKAIACPNFYRYFKQLVDKFQFQINTTIPSIFETSGHFSLEFYSLTAEQAHIFQNLPHDLADIHLITAPRGRGKSTLAGKLAAELVKKNQVLITARTQSTLPSFWHSAAQNIPFLAPDNLIEQIQRQAISPHQWLFIDEAASLPLPILHQLCHYFDKVVLTTTTENYEGTGRGFSLKFLSQLKRLSKLWQLTKPLRWQENDPLELFVNELLLLVDKETQIELANFYQLLAQAHYKTTPTDLRRLFDGENQVLHKEYKNNQLIGGIWAIIEGGLDSALTQAIWRGERRPHGSLVAQYLCFQSNLPQACELRSLRISRIAIKPKLQNRGMGKQLVSDFILQNIAQKETLDFISVSFGLTPLLYHFWKTCGFKIAQITPNKEASSGYRSAMMLYPLSEKGKIFCNVAEQVFKRDFGLQPFAAEICEELPSFKEFQSFANNYLNAWDIQNLIAFAEGYRSFSAIYISLKRLYLSDTSLGLFLANNRNISKAEITKYRKIVQDYLKKQNH